LRPVLLARPLPVRIPALAAVGRRLNWPGAGRRTWRCLLPARRPGLALSAGGLSASAAGVVRSGGVPPPFGFLGMIFLSKEERAAVEQRQWPVRLDGQLVRGRAGQAEVLLQQARFSGVISTTAVCGARAGR
jgi:hypothetical protein